MRIHIQGRVEDTEQLLDMIEVKERRRRVEHASEVAQKRWHRDEKRKEIEARRARHRSDLLLFESAVMADVERSALTTSGALAAA